MDHIGMTTGSNAKKVVLGLRVKDRVIFYQEGTNAGKIELVVRKLKTTKGTYPSVEVETDTVIFTLFGSSPTLIGLVLGTSWTATWLPCEIELWHEKATTYYASLYTS